MLLVIRNAWALLFGMLLLMIGNGMQGTLLGLRGAIEGFSADELAYVMSGYFLGFLGGSRLTPHMIRRVGHVRVFAAMASIVSAVFILYAAIPYVIAWGLMRVVVGFCFSAVYIVAESWLNDSATNETRGKLLSIYMIVQMLGIVVAQFAVNLSDPGGYGLFVIISVLVSLSFAPILLSVSPAPVFNTSKPMTLRQLVETSPLSCVGIFFLGGVYSAMFGMSAVYGTEAGLSVAEISIFVAMFYLGGLFLQFPIGWLSDRMDRRVLICGLNAIGAAFAVVAIAFGWMPAVLFACAFLVGGFANPLYSLTIAYANDFLEPEDMAAASAGLMFINGVGAIGGPLIVGYAMNVVGSWAFFAFIAVMMGFTALYAAYRMTQRPSIAVEDTAPYAPVSLEASPVVMEVAQEFAIEQIEAEAEEQEEDDDGSGDAARPVETAAGGAGAGA